VQGWAGRAGVGGQSQRAASVTTRTASPQPIPLRPGPGACAHTGGPLAPACACRPRLGVGGLRGLGVVSLARFWSQAARCTRMAREVQAVSSQDGQVPGGMTPHGAGRFHTSSAPVFTPPLHRRLQPPPIFSRCGGMSRMSGFTHAWAEAPCRPRCPGPSPRSLKKVCRGVGPCEWASRRGTGWGRAERTSKGS
jgi:hypothetical protein